MEGRRMVKGYLLAKKCRLHEGNYRDKEIGHEDYYGGGDERLDRCSADAFRAALGKIPEIAPQERRRDAEHERFEKPDGDVARIEE
jgi:hypothetical protein